MISKKQMALLIFLAIGSFIIVDEVKSDPFEPKFTYTNRSEFMQDVKSCAEYINTKEPSNIPIQLILYLNYIYMMHHYVFH